MTNLTYVAPFFIITNLKTSVSFYVDKLGFKIRYVGPDNDLVIRHFMWTISAKDIENKIDKNVINQSTKCFLYP